MPPRKATVNNPTIETVDEALFPWLEREVASNYFYWWEQSPYENVRAKMHVMMAVDPLGHSAVEPTKFFELRRDHVFERTHQCWVEKGLGQTMAPQTPGEFFLVLHKLGGAIRPRERGSKVQMQASVNLLFPGDSSCSFGILHENHCTHGRDRSSIHTAMDSSGRLEVTTPIISIDNQFPG